MPGFELQPFDIDAFPEGKTGYLLDGKPTPWNEIKDPTYATINQLMVVGGDGIARFPKIDTVYERGVFITTVRFNPERGVEILLLDEERPLLFNESGERGGVNVTSIPQGIIRQGTYEDAANRLVLKETGQTPSKIIFLGEVFLDAANSSGSHDFVLAQIPFGQNPDEPMRDETENVKNLRWLSPDEIVDMEPPLTCAKALSGIELSRKHFPRLLQQGQELQL